MRLFFEEWYPYVNRQPVADDLTIVDGDMFLSEIRQPLADDIDWSEFISIGFSHHMEILVDRKMEPKTKRNSLKK